MDDLISRQAAIDAIVAWTVEDRPDIEMPTDLVGRINDLPSVQPEPKKGRWILKNSASYMCECSECKAENMYAYLFDYETNDYKQQDYYCPNCGADMRGEEDADRI